MGFIKQNRWKVLTGIVVVAVSAGLFVNFGPPQLMARTETPSFCGSCHVMQSQYEAWFHVGAHRSIKCVDCHLPHDNLGNYYFWKSFDGMWDVAVFYSGRAPEMIEISARQQGVVQSNCIRCHELRVSEIDQERHCWDCHRWLQHRAPVVRATQ